VVEASGSSNIPNIFPVTVNNEFGEFVFQALEAPADYYFYYFPYKLEGRNYPKVTYLPADYQADTGWLLRNGLRQDLLSRFNPSDFPWGEVLAFECVDEFSTFYPMEVIATASEVNKIIEHQKNQPFLVFPEDRQNPVRMENFLPARWVVPKSSKLFEGQADRGEYYVFQLAVFAFQQKLEELRIEFSDLKKVGSDEIIASALATCLNTGGTGWDGQPFKKRLTIEKGQVQSLWCGWQIPENVSAGDYEGYAEIIATDLPSQKIRLKIRVTERVVQEAGDSELWRLSRLRWLNSLLAVDDEIVAPFTPLEVRGRTIDCLGRSLKLSKYGLPEEIQSYFNQEVTGLSSKPLALLDAPFELAVRNFSGIYQEIKNKSFSFTKQTPGTVCWQAINEIPSLNLSMEVSGRMEFDGYVEFRIKIKASQEVEVDDLRLTVALREESALYMMGLGFKGGPRPKSFSWFWDREKNQDALWIGTVNAGLQVQFRAENYSRPLNTNFYRLKPRLPGGMKEKAGSQSEKS
jgi:hypothetical protein